MGLNPNRQSIHIETGILVWEGKGGEDRVGGEGVGKGLIF